MTGWDCLATYYGRPVQDPCISCFDSTSQRYLRSGAQTNGDAFHVYRCGICGTEYYSKYFNATTPVFNKLSQGDRVLEEMRRKVKNFSLFKEEKRSEKNIQNQRRNRASAFKPTRERLPRG